MKTRGVLEQRQGGNTVQHQVGAQRGHFARRIDAEVTACATVVKLDIIKAGGEHAILERQRQLSLAKLEVPKEKAPNRELGVSIEASEPGKVQFSFVPIGAAGEIFAPLAGWPGMRRAAILLLQEIVDRRWCACLGTGRGLAFWLLIVRRRGPSPQQTRMLEVELRNLQVGHDVGPRSLDLERSGTRYARAFGRELQIGHHDRRVI